MTKLGCGYRYSYTNNSGLIAGSYFGDGPGLSTGLGYGDGITLDACVGYGYGGGTGYGQRYDGFNGITYTRLFSNDVWRE